MFIPSNILRPNMILAEDIIVQEEVYLPKDTTLTEEDITNINIRGIDNVSITFINNENYLSNEIINLCREAITNQDIKLIKEIAHIFDNFKEPTYIIDIEPYLASDIEYVTHIINCMQMTHLITCKLNTILEKNQKISLYEIICSSLLQDFGRICKDERYLNKLNETYNHDISSICYRYPVEKEMLNHYQTSAHPLYSYLLVRHEQFSDNINQTILYHHQTPNNLIEELPTVKRMCDILRLVDLYDAILYENKKHFPHEPFKNVQTFLERIVAKYNLDATVAKLIKAVVPFYQVGMKVMLSDNTKAMIIGINQDDMQNPIIADLSGREIDLHAEESLNIMYPYFE